MIRTAYVKFVELWPLDSRQKEPGYVATIRDDLPWKGNYDHLVGVIHFEALKALDTKDGSEGAWYVLALKVFQTAGCKIIGAPWGLGNQHRREIELIKFKLERFERALRTVLDIGYLSNESIRGDQTMCELNRSAANYLTECIRREKGAIEQHEQRELSAWKAGIIAGGFSESDSLTGGEHWTLLDAKAYPETEWSNNALLEAFDYGEFYNGPGQRYGSKPQITRSTSYVLLKQYLGLDV